MSDALAAVLVVLAVILVVTASAALVAWRSLRRRVEISRRHRCGAPVRWLVWPGTLAGLHRRLRDAVVVLRAAVPAPPRRRAPEGPLEPIAEEIERHAVALSRNLQLVARLHGPAKVHARDHLARQVVQLEALAHRVAAGARAARPVRPGERPTDEAMAAIAEQLDALEAARAELARLEAAAGLPAQR